ncbi:hypothetical protein JCM11491_003533 [Sporobolomyces phaffii]
MSASSPTIYVHYGHRHVKARIDHEVPLDEIIRQLAASSQLQVAEPAALFALRVHDTGQLVTQDNLHALLASPTTKNVFTLGSSPTIEAVETIDKLAAAITPGLTSDDTRAALKLATFSLKTLVKDPAFLDAFLARGGLAHLERVATTTAGNTLAYSLVVVRDLCHVRHADALWRDLSPTLVARVVDVVATEPLINISRPATSTLAYLAAQPATPTAESGFARILPHLVSPRSSRVLANLVSHLPSNAAQKNLATKTSGGGGGGGTKNGTSLVDTESSELSLKLLEGLLKGFVNVARDAGDDADAGSGGSDLHPMTLDEFRRELDTLGLYKIISVILDDATVGPSPSARPAASAALVSLSTRFLETFLDSFRISHAQPLSLHRDHSLIRAVSDYVRGPERDDGPDDEADLDWIRDPASRGREQVRQFVEWYLGRSPGEVGSTENRSLAVGKVDEPETARRERSVRIRTVHVSFEITRLLSRHFELDVPLPSPSSSSSLRSGPGELDPLHSVAAPAIPTSRLLVFDLPELHGTLVEFWLKLDAQVRQTSNGPDHPSARGIDHDGVVDDKVRELVVVQIEQSFVAGKSLAMIRSEFEASDYKSIRARQLERFELAGDDILSKPPVASLRAKIRRECVEFVKEQRIDCLLQGIWIDAPTRGPGDEDDDDDDDDSAHESTFWKLSPSRKTLTFGRVKSREAREVVERQLGESGRSTGPASPLHGRGTTIALASIRNISISSSSEMDATRRSAQEREATRPGGGPAKLHRRTPSTSRLSSFFTSSPPPAPAPAPSTATWTAASRPVQEQGAGPRRLGRPATTTISITLEYDDLDDAGRGARGAGAGARRESTFTCRARARSPAVAELIDALRLVVSDGDVFEPSTSAVDADADGDPSTTTAVVGENEMSFDRCVESLTDVAVRVRLLDLTGDGIDVLEAADDDDKRDASFVGVVAVPSEDERFYYKEFI